MENIFLGYNEDQLEEFFNSLANTYYSKPMVPLSETSLICLKHPSGKVRAAAARALGALDAEKASRALPEAINAEPNTFAKSIMTGSLRASGISSLDEPNSQVKELQTKLEQALKENAQLKEDVVRYKQEFVILNGLAKDLQRCLRDL